MKLKSAAKRVFEEFRKAQAAGDKTRIVETLKRLDEVFEKESLELTLKQRKFCLAFVGEADGNGSEAARIAGYKGNDVTLAAVAYENLNKPQIQAQIADLRAQAEKKLGGRVLSAAEVLIGLTRIAQADVAEVFETDGSFDLASAKRRGVSKLIKSMKFDKDTGRLVSLELHNAHGAHVDLGKYWKLFTDKIEIVNPTAAAKEAFQAVLTETGLSEDKARQIVAARFGITEQELISKEIM